MKKSTIVSIFLVMLIHTKHAVSQEKEYDQIFKKNNNQIGGGITFSSLNDDSDPLNQSGTIQRNENRSFSFSPTYGRFIKDNTLIGISLNVGSSSREIIQEDNIRRFTSDSEASRLGVGIFVKRYYKIEGRFGVYIQPQASFFMNETNSESNSFDLDPIILSDSFISDSETMGLNFTTNLGLFVVLGKKFILETNLLGISAQTSQRETTNINVFSGEQTGTEGDFDTFNINLINTLSFDQILVFNYVF